MTGGMAFVYDADGGFEHSVNDDTLIWQRVATPYWDGVVKDIVAEHVRETQSRFAEAIVRDWDRELPKFWQIVPKEMLTRLAHPLTKEKRARKKASA
jgi:glutamate synthase (NADPH/NADH) large chain